MGCRNRFSKGYCTGYAGFDCFDSLNMKIAIKVLKKGWGPSLWYSTALLHLP